MDDLFIINPSRVEVGIPVTIQIPKEKVVGKETEIQILSKQENIISPLTAGPNGILISQFALYRAGTYHIQLGSHSQELVVYPHTDISFAIEFWAFALTVISILGGMVIWSRKKKTRVVGSI